MQNFFNDMQQLAVPYNIIGFTLFTISLSAATHINNLGSIQHLALQLTTDL